MLGVCGESLIEGLCVCRYSISKLCSVFDSISSIWLTNLNAVLFVLCLELPSMFALLYVFFLCWIALRLCLVSY